MKYMYNEYYMTLYMYMHAYMYAVLVHFTRATVAQDSNKLSTMSCNLILNNIIHDIVVFRASLRKIMKKEKYK